MATTNLEDTVKTLKELTQYEIDGSFLFSQAIDNVSNSDIRDQLSTIKQEYEDNIHELSKLIKDMGQEPPAHSRDFKGFFMQGYTALRGLVSDQGVLKALHTNVQMALRALEEALRAELSEDVRKPVSKVYEVGKKHLNYLASQI